MIYIEKGHNFISGYRKEILADLIIAIANVTFACIREMNIPYEDVRAIISTCALDGIRIGEEQAFEKALDEYKQEVQEYEEGDKPD